MTAGSITDERPEGRPQRRVSTVEERALPPSTAPAVLSVDLEDYYHVAAFEGAVRREDWRWYPSRVTANVERLLDLFDEYGVRATFFVLGWEARQRPALVRQVADRGHEVACHSYLHRRAYELTPDQFREDTLAAAGAIEDAAGIRVQGYRAPSFSVTRRSLYALDVLAELGFRYDSSIFPVRHPEYGVPGAPFWPHPLERAGRTIWELPPATMSLFGQRIAVAGGAYLRHLPYPFLRSGLRRLVRNEQTPAMLYLHPWEIDPAQPRLAVPSRAQFRHYRNLDRTLPRLERLLREFQFVTASELVDGLERAQPAGVAATSSARAA